MSTKEAIQLFFHIHKVFNIFNHTNIKKCRMGSWSSCLLLACGSSRGRHKGHFGGAKTFRSGDQPGFSGSGTRFYQDDHLSMEGLHGTACKGLKGGRVSVAA